MSGIEYAAFLISTFIAGFVLTRQGLKLFFRWYDGRHAAQVSEQAVRSDTTMLLNHLRPAEQWPPADWEDLLAKFVTAHPDAKTTENHPLADWVGIETWRNRGLDKTDPRKITYPSDQEDLHACECFEYVEDLTLNKAHTDECVCGHRWDQHDESSCTVVIGREGKTRSWVERRAQTLGTAQSTDGLIRAIHDLNRLVANVQQPNAVIGTAQSTDEIVELLSINGERIRTLRNTIPVICPDCGVTRHIELRRGQTDFRCESCIAQERALNAQPQIIQDPAGCAPCEIPGELRWDTI